jgi:hypothetical protein
MVARDIALWSLPALTLLACWLGERSGGPKYEASGDAAAPVAERNAAVLARWIVATGAKLINVREIHRGARLPGLRDLTAIEAAIAVLEGGD